MEGWPEKAKVALAAYALMGITKTALNAARIRAPQISLWKKKLPGFRMAWDRAKEMAADTLEQEAWDRAVTGQRQVVYYRGEKVGTRRVKSDNLLMFLLKGVRPEKFSEKAQGIDPGEALLGLQALAKLGKRMKRAEKEAVIPAVKVKVLKEG